MVLNGSDSEVFASVAFAAQAQAVVLQGASSVVPAKAMPEPRRTKRVVRAKAFFIFFSIWERVEVLLSLVFTSDAKFNDISKAPKTYGFSLLRQSAWAMPVN